MIIYLAGLALERKLSAVRNALFCNSLKKFKVHLLRKNKMPGFVIHLSVAKEVIRLVTQYGPVQWNAKEIEEFYIGNLLPDIKPPKKLSHYWGGKQMHEIIRIPDLHRFMERYGSRFMSNKQLLGYYCHLCVDKFFFEDFLLRRVCFLDENNNPTNSLKLARYVYLYREDKIIPYKEFWTTKYYYGDFDKMNPALRKRYSINEDELPGEIKEHDIEINPGLYLSLQRNLKKYLKKNREGSLKVFREEDIEMFIEDTAADLKNHILNDFTV